MPRLCHEGWSLRPYGCQKKESKRADSSALGQSKTQKTLTVGKVNLLLTSAGSGLPPLTTNRPRNGRSESPQVLRSDGVEF